jgi:predicted nuclease of predicted toxin-antitoxin system
MRFLLDESIDIRLADYLREHGHDVVTVAADYQPSIPDTEVLAIAERKGRMLLTNDRDFGQLVFLHGQPHAGVLYFRLGTFEVAPLASRLEQVLRDYSEHLDEFLVVTPRSVRVRR